MNMESGKPSTAGQGPDPEKRKIKVEDIFAFGKLLADAREEKQVSADSVAAKLGMTKGEIMRLENGEEFPEEHDLSDIAQAYGIGIESLRAVFEISQEARELERESLKIRRGLGKNATKRKGEKSRETNPFPKGGHGLKGKHNLG